MYTLSVLFTTYPGDEIEQINARDDTSDDAAGGMSCGAVRASLKTLLFRHNQGIVIPCRTENKWQHLVVSR